MAFTVGFCSVEVNPAGPSHEYERLASEFAVVAEPFKITSRIVQVNSMFSPASATGAVLSSVTSTVSVDEHPLSVSVTVSVYVPVALTVGFCSFEPYPSGPVHS